MVVTRWPGLALLTAPTPPCHVWSPGQGPSLPGCDGAGQCVTCDMGDPGARGRTHTGAAWGALGGPGGARGEGPLLTAPCALQVLSL